MNQPTPYDKAWNLAGDLILIPENTPSEELTVNTTNQLKEALNVLSSVLKYDVSALWLHGKIQQRLGKFEDSLQSFLAANQLMENNLDVVVGVITGALESARPKIATKFSLLALKKWPDDELLQSLAAMSFLIAGDLTKAKEIAEICDDRIVLTRCDNIERRKECVPKNIFEIFQIA